MPSGSEVKFEIGHVLFIDIVGYSKLLINEQSEQIQKLKEIVRGTEQFRLAETEGKLLRLPTGDGGALVFRNSLEAPVLCALEIGKELKSHPELHVRMGIHSGPVNEVTDLNEQANVAGAGINIAQRVMDCGDAGHILVSKRVGDDLEQYQHWRSLLHELGECEVKHGLRISLLNLYGDEAGNPELPEKFRQAVSADNLHLEIGHVLFMDIVGYSKLLVDEQAELVKELGDVVNNTEAARQAEAGGQLIRLPSGDGMALVFTNSVEAPVRCALEMSAVLKTKPNLPLRMGVHSGPVQQVEDVNARTSVAGAGINLAQRVMDCGDAGHILLSKRVADDLAQFRYWRPFLHDLGECEVKHGVRLHLVNVYAESLGNAALPQKFQQAKPKPAAEKPARRSSVGWVAALLLAALLAAGAAYYFISHRPKSAAIPEKSIAVLPLVNSTGDPANEYFSDGMSEEFISSLSRLQELKVIGRTSSFQFKGKTDPSKTIGEKLGVFYLLEGSVRKSADRVRIAVALIKSADGANVWSETYDRELKDIFAVQSEIAGAVAKELKVALRGTNGQTAQLTTAATPSNQNVEAYNALLQGNFYNNRHTGEDTQKAIGYYEEAIRLDPRYALAYAKLSVAANALGANYGSATKEREEAIARLAAKRSLELDPNLAAAHSAQGVILMDYDFNFVEAEAEFRRALQLAPQNASVMQNFTGLLSRLGRLDEAATLAQRAIALEPLRSALHTNLAGDLTVLGRYDEAEAASRKAIELQPQSAQNYSQLAIIQILRGKSGAAVEFAKKETNPVLRTYTLALAHFANGDRAEADAALKKLIDENADQAASQIAQVYALRKEPDKMFEWLEHGWPTNDPGVTELLDDPFLRAYKDDPRFIVFAQKVGVMPKAAAKQ